MHRMPRPAVALAVAAVAALAAGPAAPPAGAAGRVEAGLRLGAFEPTNSADTYDALYGGTMTQVGLQVEVHTRRRLFFQATFDRGTADGERVAPAPGGFVPTGGGITLELSPLHLTAAWLFRPRDAAWNAYAGVGPSLLVWSEKGDLDRSSSTDAGGSVVLGLRKPFRAWSLGGELRWSTFPNAFGDEGLAAALGEGDLGGFGLHLLGLYRF